MMENPSDEMFGGFWPFLKRFIMMLLPVWVFLLFFAAKAPIWVSSIMAGLSLAPVMMYEKLSLKKRFEDEKS